MEAISSLAALLTLCGITSVRMFAPTFLFGAICRFLPSFSWCPEGVARLAESCPSYLTSNLGLVFFGLLGVLEITANWNDTVRELISESNVETYVKPVFAVLMAFSILTPDQAQAVAVAVGDAANAVASDGGSTAFEAVSDVASGAVPATSSESGATCWAILGSLLCCGVTAGLCWARARIVAVVREMDPENAFHMNTLLTLFEEGAWVAVLLILLTFPLLAFLMMVAFAFCGWLLSRPIAKICEKRRKYWDGVGEAELLRRIRFRAIVIFVIGVVVSGIPVVGFLATVAALHLFVFGVLALYEDRSTRIFFKLAVRFGKLLVLLFAVVFSSIPFLGAALLLPYVVSYLIRVRRFRRRFLAAPRSAEAKR